MLLSSGSLMQTNSKLRATSNFRGSNSNPMQLADIMSNTSMLQTNMSQSTMIDSSQPMKQKRSLNFINKKREAERIDQENIQIMKRLQTQTVSPHLDTKVIRRQMHEIEKYKKTI